MAQTRSRRGFRIPSEAHFTLQALAFVALVSLCASASDHSIAGSQGAHKDSPPGSQQVMEQSWSVQQGAPQNTGAIAQTVDGFLWLGGQGGLFRFDGTRFERFHPSLGDRLPSSDVSALFAPPTGGLWVGYLFGGFSFVNNGSVTDYSKTVALQTGTVYTLARDFKGTMWAGTGRGVWRFDGSKWQKLGAEWDAPMVISNVGIDRADTVWVIAGFPNYQKLLYLLPGSKRFQVANPNLDASGFTLDADQKVVTGPIKLQTPSRESIPHNGLREYPLFGRNGAQIVDRTNAVWTTGGNCGLTRIGAAFPFNDAVAEKGTKSSETYAASASRKDLHGTLVDREGNIWYADSKGLHRFFYVPFFEQELPARGNAAIAADDDGAIWAGFFTGQSETSHELYRVTHGQVETIRFRTPVNWGAAYRASDKTIWFGGSGGLWHLVRGKPLQVALPKELAKHAFYLQAITEDRAGALWISFIHYGLYRYADGVWTSFGQRNGLPAAGPYVEFTDSLGRMWFGYSGFWKIRLAVLDGNRVRTYSSSDGVPAGNVTAISGRGSDVWIGSEFGLDKFDGERFHAIHAVDDDWLLGISGIVESANGDLWLNGVSGIFHIRQSEIAEALRNPSYRVTGEHLGARDGLPGIAAQMRPICTAIESSDGRLWFSLTSGVVWLDPNRAQHQAIVPPVTIQSVSADDKVYEAASPLTFPAHSSSVTIRYSAISLSDPEAIRSRVRLRETDANWHEVSTGQPVTYRNLAPGQYHFSVEASDTDGVWSGKVASVAFTILPAWYQTTWFYILCAVAFLALLWAVYQLRLRQVRLQFAAGLEQRVNERTRIARELHDTLLQSFQGAVFQFQAARRLLLRNADNAMVVVDEAIHAAEEGIAEGRAAIRDLRPEPAAQRDLPALLSNAGRELATAHEQNGLAPSYRVVVEGKQQDLSPMLQDEVYRISREVIRNAFTHAAASLIEVEIRYDENELRLRIRDDGKGMDPEILRAGELSGHWGIPGMRERAQRIGARLDFWSEAGAGTEVQLAVPAAMAYEKRQHGARFRFFRRTGRDDERS